MKISLALGVALALSAPVAAEPLSYSEARKVLPRVNAKPIISVDSSRVPEADRARLERAGQTIDDVLSSIGAAIPAYGALAFSPSEGFFVEWISGAGHYHSVPAARAAALSYCNSKRKSSSDPCEIAVVIAPRGVKEGAPLTLSGPANAALRGEYRKLKAPKAFAISESTGNFGFDRGDGGRALAACSTVGQGAEDCRIVVAD
jgi:hypothetical protein